MGERQHRFVHRKKSILAEEIGDTSSRKTCPKFSTRSKRLDRPLDSFSELRLVSSQTQLSERDGGVHSALSSSACTTVHRAHFSSVGTPQWFKVKRACVIPLFHIWFLDVVVGCTVRPFPFGSFLSYRIVIKTFSVHHIHGKELS